MSGSSQSRPALAPARQVVPSRFAPAVQAPVTSSTTSDKPIVYAKDRHDGSFWGTSYGLDALKPPEIHQNSLMIDDEQNVDETEYYEEPREAVAARTGAKLPTYADDAADHLYHHRSTYSMHDAKHMKHKISYDLFSSSASKASDSYDDDDDDVDEDTRDAHGHGRKKHDESVDFEALAESQSFVPKESSKHNKNRGTTQLSARRRRRALIAVVPRTLTKTTTRVTKTFRRTLSTVPRNTLTSPKSTHQSRTRTPPTLSKNPSPRTTSTTTTSTKTTTRVFQPGSNGTPPRPRKARNIPVIVLHNQS